MGKFLNHRFTIWWVEDLKLFKALACRALDNLNCQHTEVFVQIFQKSQMPRDLP